MPESLFDGKTRISRWVVCPGVRIADAQMRYIHRWHVPIVVKVYGVDEYFYYAPYYDPRLLPVNGDNEKDQEDARRDG